MNGDTQYINNDNHSIKRLVKGKNNRVYRKRYYNLKVEPTIWEVSTEEFSSE